MQKNILDSYLSYIQEIDVDLGLKTAGGIGGIAKSAVKGSILYGLLIPAGVWTTWRALTGIFSSAARKCGTFGRGPGRTACVSREKLKAYQQKLAMLNNIKNGCPKAKQPEICEQKFNIEIEKVKNGIDVEKAKLKNLFNESQNIYEIAPIAFAGAIFMGMFVDKAIFTAWRSALALFSKASRQCGVFKKGPERGKCLSEIRLKSLAQQQFVLKRLLTTCPKQKNPEKCKLVVAPKLEEINRKVQIEQDSIKVYDNEIETNKREAEFKAAQKANKNKKV